ncbi:MAG: virulence RhuM family protein [Treponema sp.]|nr:virulence RhuM family protein [Treponema sp.]
MDEERLKQGGTILTEDYFDKQLEKIREIRLSERRFYQKITDIYATSLDYDKTAKTTREFFAKVQNKLHFAVYGNTAAEVIYNCANAEQKNMGLTTWNDAPDGKIQRSDVMIAKNYLSEEEMRSLELIVSAYLDLAERRAMAKMPMTMIDWAHHLDLILQADGNELLTNAGTISAQIAEDHALCEFEKYRIIQDRLFESDFDRFVAGLKKLEEKTARKRKSDGT